VVDSQNIMLIIKNMSDEIDSLIKRIERLESSVFKEIKTKEINYKNVDELELIDFDFDNIEKSMNLVIIDINDNDIGKLMAILLSNSRSIVNKSIEKSLKSYIDKSKDNNRFTYIILATKRKQNDKTQLIFFGISKLIDICDDHVSLPINNKYFTQVNVQWYKNSFDNYVWSGYKYYVKMINYQKQTMIKYIDDLGVGTHKIYSSSVRTTILLILGYKYDVENKKYIYTDSNSDTYDGNLYEDIVSWLPK
jgi:hypothetical protein